MSEIDKASYQNVYDSSIKGVKTMKIERAIECLASCSIIPFDPDAGEISELAITALHEKQEREKWCEGCNGRNTQKQGKPYQCQYCSRNYSDKHDIYGRKLGENDG